MAYRILRKINDKCYEDFGFVKNEEMAKAMIYFISQVIGYKQEDFYIEKVGEE